MKKAVSIVGALAAILLVYGGSIFLFASSNVAAAEPKVKLYLTPATAKTPVGSTISFQVRLSKNTTAVVDYANADMIFPTASLEIVSISKVGGHFSKDGGPSTAYSNAVGTISVKGEGASLATKADVLLATITLRAKKTGSANISFTSKSQAGDINNGGHVKNAMDAWTGAIVTVSSTPSQPNAPPTTGSDDEEGDDDARFDDEEGLGDDESLDESDFSEEEVTDGSEEEGQATDEGGSGEGTEPDSESTITVASDDGSSASGPGAVSFWQRYLWPLLGVGVLVVAGVGWAATTLVMLRRAAVPAVPLLAEESVDIFGDEAQLTTVPDEAVDTVPETLVAAVPEEVVSEIAEPASEPVPAVVPQPVPQPQVAPVAPPQQPVPSAAAPHVAQLTVPDRAVETQLTSERAVPDVADIPDMFEIGEQRLQSEGLADMKSSAQNTPAETK